MPSSRISYCCRVWIFAEIVVSWLLYRLCILYDNCFIFILWFLSIYLSLHLIYLSIQSSYVSINLYCIYFAQFRLPYLVRDANEQLANETIITCILPAGGGPAILTRHPAGTVTVNLPDQTTDMTGKQHNILFMQMWLCQCRYNLPLKNDIMLLTEA